MEGRETEIDHLNPGCAIQPSTINLPNAHSSLSRLSASRFTAFDIGAQLSFAAVWGLIRVAPALYRLLGPAETPNTRFSGLRPLHAGLAGVLAVSLAAHLATAPILAFHFQRVSWSGLLANVPMSLLTVLFTHTALLHSLLSGIGAPALGPAVDYTSGAFTGWAGFFAVPPFGAREVFPFPAGLVPIYYAVLALPSLLPPSRRRTGALLAALAAALFLAERLPASPPPQATVRAIDVDQGDALLLQTTDGANILVDTGRGEPGRGAPSLVRALRALRVGSLDAVVVTHADSDHLGGLPRLLQHLPVKLLIQRVDPDPEEAELWARVIRIAVIRKIRTLSPEPGSRIRVGSSELTFLGPLTATRGNEASLVFRWDAGGGRVLLTGDAGEPSEREMLRWGAELRADVLKAGHHGSDGSTSATWLRAVQPSLALISCGRDNPFGHPAPSVLERLKAAGVTIARTDRGGMQTVRMHRGRITLESRLREE